MGGFYKCVFKLILHDTSKNPPQGRLVWIPKSACLHSEIVFRMILLHQFLINKSIFIQFNSLFSEQKSTLQSVL